MSCSRTPATSLRLVLPSVWSPPLRLDWLACEDWDLLIPTYPTWGLQPVGSDPYACETRTIAMEPSPWPLPVLIDYTISMYYISRES